MAINYSGEDFVLNTLQGVNGCLGKLEYLNSLRDENGTIHHWGLEKIYGAERTGAEFESAYGHSLNQLLRTPYQVLWKEFMESCTEKERAPQTFLHEFRENIFKHMPKEFDEAQNLHVRQVLDVVSALADHSRS